MALALAAGAVLLAGAASIGKGRFTELDVERINLREADGTIGMVIANRERLPGLYLRTTEHAHDRGGDKSGMLLFNDVTDGVQPPVLSGQDKAANAAGDYAITPRVLLGKSGSQNAALLLNDGNGPPAAAGGHPGRPGQRGVPGRGRKDGARHRTSSRLSHTRALPLRVPRSDGSRLGQSAVSAIR